MSISSFLSVYAVLTLSLLVGLLFRMSNGSSKAKIIFGVVVVFGIVLRIGLSSLGHNYDMECWSFWAELVKADASQIYSTRLFGQYSYSNYAPVWLLILPGLKALRDCISTQHPEALHIVVACFLSLFDAGIALLLAKRYGWLSGGLYILCPVVILLSGFHSQIESFSLFFGLLAWFLLDAENVHMHNRWWQFIAAGALLGLSLAIKHVLFLFPVWILFATQLGPLKQRFVCVCIAYGFFAGSFTPWVFDEASRAGIAEGVFRYSSSGNSSLMPYIVNMFVPVTLVEHALGGVPVFSGLKAVFLLGMVGMGFLTALKAPRQLFPAYLLAMIVFSPACASQYLAIPVIACVMWRRRYFAWMYVFAATLFIIIADLNVTQAVDKMFHVALIIDPLRPLLSFSQVIVWAALLLYAEARSWFNVRAMVQHPEGSCRYGSWQDCSSCEKAGS